MGFFDKEKIKKEFTPTDRVWFWHDGDAVQWSVYQTTRSQPLCPMKGNSVCGKFDVIYTLTPNFIAT